MRYLLWFFLASASLAVEAQRMPFTYQDMLMLDRISGLSVDAAGKRILFNVRATDMERTREYRRSG